MLYGKEQHYHFYNNSIIFLFCREKFQGATWLDWQALDMWLFFFLSIKVIVNFFFFFYPRGMRLLLEDILSIGRFKWLETAKCTISTYHHCALLTDRSPHHERLIQISSFSHPATVAVICNSLPNAILPYSSAYLSSVICNLLFCLYSENHFKKSRDWHFSRSQKHIIFQS